DGYARVGLDRVMPGDIAVYEDGAGHIDHTGLVVQVATRVPPRIWVLSKWSTWGEYLQPHDVSLYSSEPYFMREGSDDDTETHRSDRGWRSPPRSRARQYHGRTT